MTLTADNNAGPVAIERSDVEAARTSYRRVWRGIPRSFALHCRRHTAEVPVLFKLEYLQHGGSFKVRGSLNAVERAVADGTMPDAGVVIASGGNAAIGAAWAARRRGLTCTVVVPETAPDAKVKDSRRVGCNRSQGRRPVCTRCCRCGGHRTHQRCARTARLRPARHRQWGRHHRSRARRRRDRTDHVLRCSRAAAGWSHGIVAAARPEDHVVAVEPTGACHLAHLARCGASGGYRSEQYRRRLVGGYTNWCPSPGRHCMRVR